LPPLPPGEGWDEGGSEGPRADPGEVPSPRPLPEGEGVRPGDAPQVLAGSDQHPPSLPLPSGEGWGEGGSEGPAGAYWAGVEKIWPG
jgi:hypothetical protein